MGTRFDLVIPGIDNDRGQTFSEALETEIRRLDNRLSRFDFDSDIAAINRSAFLHPIGLDSECWHILKSCTDFHKRTDGAFDITLRPLLTFWRDNPDVDIDCDTLPAQWEAAYEASGMDLLLMDEASQLLRFKHQQTEIDLGGYAKGYALERCKDLLDECQIEHAFVSFGGSALLGRGDHPFGSGWAAGIEHLFNNGKQVHSFLLHNQSVSTSGSVQCVQSDGSNKHRHVIDFIKGRPVSGYRTVSVVSESPLEAEVLSTALLVLAPDKRLPVLAAFGESCVVELTYEEDTNARITWAYP